MPVGLFRSEDGWAQVDYGTGATIPIPRSRYEASYRQRHHDRQDCHRLEDIKPAGVNRRAMVLSSR
jgi:hypothetical protein